MERTRNVKQPRFGYRNRKSISLGVGIAFGGLLAVGAFCGDQGEGNEGGNSSSISTSANVEASKTPFTLLSFEVKLGHKINYSWAVDGHYDASTYKEDGVKFRQALQVLEAVESPQEAGMRSLYEALKEENGGVEYLKNGEVFAPKLGERYRIMDAGKMPGIHLRTEASTEPSGETFLYHGMEVEITSDAQDTIDENGKVHKMFGIKVVDEEDYWTQEIPIKAKVGEVGFLDQIWLGARVSKASE